MGDLEEKMLSYSDPAVNPYSFVKDLKNLSIPALQQKAQEAQARGDTPSLGPILSVLQAKKQEAAKAAPAQAPQQTVASSILHQQLPENTGIGQLPAPNLQHIATGATGGIVAFADKGAVEQDPKAAFMEQYGPVAANVGKQLKVDPNILLAQWGMESRWGQATPGKFNVGNIKAAKGQAGTSAYDNAEGSNDKYVNFKSPEEFGNAYADRVSRLWPNAISAGSDVGRFSAGLKTGENGAYATDPRYSRSLAETYNSLRGSPVAAATTSGTGLASLIPTGGEHAPAGVYGWNQSNGSKQGPIASAIEDVGNFISNDLKIPPFIPAVGVVGQGVAEVNAANRAATGLEAAAGEAGTAINAAKNLRLPPPSTSTNFMERMREGLGRVSGMNEDRAAATNAAARLPTLVEKARNARLAESEAAALANTAAEGTAYANKAAGRLGLVGEAGVGAQAAGSFGAPAPTVVPPEVAPYKDDIAKTVAATVPDEAKKGLGLTNDDYLRMGLGMLASNIRGASFGQVVGEAGLGVLQNRQLQAQMATKLELEKAQAEMYRQHAAMFGARPSMAAQQNAQRNFAAWMRTAGMGTTDEQQMAALQHFTSQAMAAEQGQTAPLDASTALPTGANVSVTPSALAAPAINNASQTPA